MSKCGKGCMPECEYFVTCGCISPFNCPYKIDENYQNSAFTTGNSNFLSGIEKWFMQLVEEGKLPQTPMNYDMASYKAYVAHLEAENAELKEKAQKLDEQLKAISDRTAKFPSLEQIEKRFLDWAIPFLKARITGCKEEWFGIEWIAKAIWEFIKNGFENAIAVDETNAALRERLDKAIILPCKVGDTIYEATPVGIREWLVTSIELKDYGFKVNCEGKNDFKLHWHFVKTDCCNDFEGKGRIRVTREAAEERLAELGGESDEM